MGACEWCIGAGNNIPIRELHWLHDGIGIISNLLDPLLNILRVSHLLFHDIGKLRTLTWFKV